jgi:hypothetical protein
MVIIIIKNHFLIKFGNVFLATNYIIVLRNLTNCLFKVPFVFSFQSRKVLYKTFELFYDPKYVHQRKGHVLFLWFVLHKYPSHSVLNLKITED